jgi:hypothetical protein
MKDYRQYSKAYAPEEWETDKEWLSNRLEFLWTFRDYYPDQYHCKKLDYEKEEIYSHYGPDNEIMSKASQLHYDQYNNGDKGKLKVKDAYSIFADYNKLTKAKEFDMDTFLRKRLYIRYYHIREFISDYLGQEYEEYLHECR